MKRPALYFLLAWLMLFSFACDEGDDDSSSDEDHGDDDDTTDDDDDNDDSTGEGDALVAGAASDYLRVPVGVSLGGFAARVGFKSPYAQLMGGSLGYLDRPTAKAVYLERGETRIVIAKASLAWITGSLRTQVVNLVRERTGVDLDQGLILSATHTHSGPARTLPLPDLMGLVGSDSYDQTIVDGVAAAIAGVIVQAYENREPARLGFGYREPVDPDYLITKDRRCANGPGDFKEDRLLVGRVESAEDGRTIAMLVNFAIHGVVYGYGGFYLTGDAPEGIERGVEALYDYPMTAIFLQGSAGDVVPQMYSPSGHRREQIIDWLGHRVGRLVAQIDAEIVTDDQPSLEVMTRRYAHDRETMGYQPGEFGYYDLAGEFVEYGRGAMECGVLASKKHDSIEDCDEPETTLVDGYLGCLVNLDWPFLDPYVEVLRQSPLTVARLGDQLFFTMPGEPTSHLAVDVRQRVAETTGVPMANVNCLGYAQNYVFYLLQDWDWWQGGGEVNGSLFGWRIGPWLEDQLGELAGQLENGEQAPAGLPPVLYQEERVPVTIEASERLGEIDVQPEAATRFDVVRFAWYGGHAGVDWFTARLQRRENDAWVDVRRANGTLYDDKGWEMAVRLFPAPTYKQEAERTSREFRYLLEWETSWSDPAGELRFVVEGRAKTATGVEAYTVTSDPFTLAPTDSVSLTNLAAAVVGNKLEIQLTAAYPPDPAGRRRIRSPLAGGNHPAIVTGGAAVATVSVAGTETTCELDYDNRSNVLTGELPLSDPGADIVVSVAAGAYDDGFGNTNGEAAPPVSAAR